MVLILSLLFAFVVCAILGIKESESGIKINKNQDTSASQAVMEIPEIKKIPPAPIKTKSDIFFINNAFPTKKGDRTLDLFPREVCIKKTNISK